MASVAEREVLARRLLAVIEYHAACGTGATVEIHEDHTGTLHYPCGATVGQVQGLVKADRRHLADALTTEVLALLDPSRL